jgi:hypothetical protein
MVPAYPTVREMAGDAWDELIGYDGRFLRTIEILLRYPGKLTNEVLQGRRARYIFPIRLYLFASFLYFVAAAVVPSPLDPSGGLTLKQDDVIVRLDRGGTELSQDVRAKLLADIDHQPPILRPLLRALATDPQGFKRSFYENMPRALFVLVPLFAAVLRGFYPGGWVLHMTFSLHLHAAIFLMLFVRELSRFTNSVIVVGLVEVATLVGVVSYILIAMRSVYAQRWSRVLLKIIPIALVYSIGYGIAVLAALAWTVGW